MISLKNFSIGYDGKPLLLDNVSIDIPSGSLTSLIGRNGSGKSTLLRAISGLNGSYHGEITVGSHNLKSLSTLKLAKTLSIVTTRTPRISDLSVSEVVALGRTPYTDWIGRLTPLDHEIVDQALIAVDMQSYSRRKLTSLSDGECQRVMIARAIAQQTPVILLDEPTSFLDMPNRYDLALLLANLAHNYGKTIIFSTHELDIAVNMTDNTALISDRTIHLLPSDKMRHSPLLNHMLGSTEAADIILDRIQK